jgi:beta-galactosidase
MLIRTEIWGHSNFDDARLPAIRLGSLRGLQGITAVIGQRDLSKNWRFAPVASDDEQKAELLRPEQDTSDWIIVDWANWLTAQHPQQGCFRKQFIASEDVNSWTLHFPGLQFLAEVTVNGRYMGHINPYTPYINISSEVQAGQLVDVAIYTEKFYLAPGGTVSLLEGMAAEDWWVAGCGESELVASSQEMHPRAVSTELPFRLSAGELSWLWGELPDLKTCHTICFSGRNAKISAFFNGKLVGRLWLPSVANRPIMKGGADDVVYLPGPWFHVRNNILALLVEAIMLGEEAEITAVELLRQ